MPFFRYMARDKSGKLIDERVEIKSEEDLVNSLQARGLIVISIGPASEVKVKKKGDMRKYHKAVKPHDLIMFSRELATLLGAGVTLIKSLEILCKQIESQTLLKTVEQIKKDVEGGYTFQSALKKHDKIFSNFWINLVETGEASGHLPLSLDQVAAYLEENAELKRKIMSALMYPLVLVVVATGAIAVFLIKIIPVFSEIFKGFDVELPVLTQIVISVSNIARKYFLVVIVAVVVIVVVMKKYISTDKGRWQFDSIMIKIPVVGQLIQEIATERFASGLGTLIKSGVPILHALEISEKTAGNKIMEKELKEVRMAVKEGKGMGKTMQNSSLFSPLVIQMISVGEEIGELGKMLDRVSVFYKERVNTFISRVTTMFEPIILVFMGIVVGILVVAMFMPIFSLSSAVKASG
ncbi:MAG: type II secretion system F family protein [Candidatus Omnitrophota bacterium]|nr:type II secretion system F family protein [Candidatus Omnitrophota bacterium]